MAVTSAHITLSSVVDVKSTCRYYLLQSDTLAKPSAPTSNPPGDSWTETEPVYTDGASDSLYYVDLAVFSDDTYTYSPVSLSTAYEAAKDAHNTANSAQDTADSANEKIDNLAVGAKNLIRNSTNLDFSDYHF